MGFVERLHLYAPDPIIEHAANPSVVKFPVSNPNYIAVIPVDDVPDDPAES